MCWLAFQLVLTFKTTYKGAPKRVETITAQHTAYKKTQHIEHTAHTPFTAPLTLHRNMQYKYDDNNSGLLCAYDQCV